MQSEAEQWESAFKSAKGQIGRVLTVQLDVQQDAEQRQGAQHPAEPGPPTPIHRTDSSGFRSGDGGLCCHIELFQQNSDNQRRTFVRILSTQENSPDRLLYLRSRLAVRTDTGTQRKGSEGKRCGSAQRSYLDAFRGSCDRLKCLRLKQ